MATRECGSCTLCCKLMGIQALDKPLGTWCQHCQPGKGCGIYPDRPQECRTFKCLWLSDETLGEEWYPKKSKIVLTYEHDRLIAHVDPSTPNAWKERPYFAALSQMMQAGLQKGMGVYVAINQRHIMLLPDRQEDLGNLTEADEVVLSAVMRPGGLEYRVAVTRGAPGPAGNDAEFSQQAMQHNQE